MKIQGVSGCQAYKGQPKYVCATCVKLSADNQCPVFQRPVVPNENRCFYHSTYQPIVVIFRPVRDTDAMIEDGEGKGLKYA